MNPSDRRRAMLARRRILTLLAGAAPVALAGRASAQPAEATARISVDATRDLWAVPKGLRGFNFWGTRSDKAFFPEYQKIGVGLLRFPPGRTGDENDLAKQLMDECGTTARGIGAELMPMVRLRGSIPERAADSVRYMNTERGYGARYWEVGNEPDLYRSRAGEPEFSPAWYAEQFRAYAQAMKAVDPSILVFGPVVSNAEWLEEWLPPFLAAAGDVVDGISWHFYASGPQTPEAELMASPARFDAAMAKLRQWWSDPNINPKGHRRSVPFALTEWAASYQSTSPKNLTSHAAALWTADMLGRLMVNRVDLAAYFAMWGLQFHGVWDRRGGLRPVHNVFLIFKEFGEQLLAAETDQPLLTAYAGRRADGAITLLVVNKSPDTAQRAAIDIQGARASGGAQIWRHAEGQPASAEPYSGPTDRLDVTFPPYTSSLLVIPAERSAAVPWGAVGAGLLGAAAGGLLAFRMRRRR